MIKNMKINWLENLRERKRDYKKRIWVLQKREKLFQLLRQEKEVRATGLQWNTKWAFRTLLLGARTAQCPENLGRIRLRNLRILGIMTP